MSTRLLHLTVRLRLALSILLLLGSLLFLWAASGFVMPTPGLAHTKAAAEYGVSPGTPVAHGTIRLSPEALHPNAGSRWQVNRLGQAFSVSTLDRTGLFFWRTDSFQVLVPGQWENTPVPYCYLALGSLYSQSASLEIAGTEAITLALTSDPAVARVELTQCWYSPRRDGPDGMAHLLRSGAVTDCQETAPGSGIWIGRQVWPQGDGTALTLLRAYDASGALLYEDLPLFDS